MRRALPALTVVVGAALWMGSATAGHSEYYWAGSWATNNGTVAWRVMDTQELETAKTAKDATVLFNRLPCGSGATYYRGAYQANGDKGKIMGCATGDQKHLLGRYVSNFTGVSGSVDLRIVSTSPVRFSGPFREDRVGGSSGTYSGTWQRHFAGDNASGPGSLPAKTAARAVRVVLEDKQFVPASATLVNGGSVTICNSDPFRHKPFIQRLVPHPNRLDVVLLPGACVSFAVRNPTKAEIQVRVYDHIHSLERLVLTVLPG